MPTLLLTEENVREALKQVIDPELGVNVVDLGLVYGIAIVDGQAEITMTLTTPGCPLHDSLSEAVQTAVSFMIPTVKMVSVNLVWDPPWSPDRITKDGRRELGWR